MPPLTSTPIQHTITHPTTTHPTTLPTPHQHTTHLTTIQPTYPTTNPIPPLTHPSLPTPLPPTHPPTPRTLKPTTHGEKVGPLCLIFNGLHKVYPFGRQIFGFPYLSLKLSFQDVEISSKNFVSTPWKIIILLWNSVRAPYMGHTNPSGWVMISFLHHSVIF